MNDKQGEVNSDINNWQIFILFLSIYVILALIIEAVLDVPEDVSRILDTIDNAVCVMFLVDFFWRLINAESKAAFLKWGWIDFVSSIPTFEALRWGRAVRIVRILRILRGVRSSKIIIYHLFKNRAKGAFFSVAMISFVMVVFGSIAILQVEPFAPEANIKNGHDALWWAFVTITTVGYGDFYPVTTTGRVIASVLMTAGVGLFGTFTAYVANMFLDESNDSEVQLNTGIDRQLNRICELARLKESGYLSTEEFEVAKGEIFRALSDSCKSLSKGEQ